MSKKNKPKPAPPTLKDTFGKLTDDEKAIELARGITVAGVYNFIQKNDRKNIAKFVYERFYRRYIMPFEKVCPEYNSGFAQMAACCLMIEAMESFRYGWNDTMKDSDKSGGEIFEGFFTQYDNFKEFRKLGKEFYKSIRCGILHQAEVQNGWMIRREGVLFDEPNRTINSTIFRRRMKKCLKQYCDELEIAGIDSELWKKFKDKMAFVIQNCHAGNMKS